MLIAITPTMFFWASGGMADTPVLGTGLERGEGSSPFSPTKNCSWLNSSPFSKLHGNGSCTHCCTCCISSNSELKEGVIGKDFLKGISLRKFCTPSYIFTRAYNTTIPMCFFKHIIYSLVHHSCNTMQLN